MEMPALFAAAGRTMLDALLPPRCIACGGIVGAGTALCADCWPGLDLITAPQCARCGLPFDFDLGEGALCGGCAASPPAFERARAALRYNDLSARLIVGFKRADRTHLVPAFARWLQRAAGPLLEEADLVACVPLHRRRLLARRYNQSAMLALALSRLAGRPVAIDLLARTRATPSQGGLNRNQRFDNLRGAIAVRPHRAALVPGRRILLVDDVFTTGATVEACARTLYRAGAAGVDVVTLARVVRATT